MRLAGTGGRDLARSRGEAEGEGDFVSFLGSELFSLGGRVGRLGGGRGAEGDAARRKMGAVALASTPIKFA